ncbi:MAG TPA: hypothetical protein VMJ65_11240 [Solirubrobacteraceae bacterium]|nr:hypothetical protein [Solirubrobacteraceae bacterium]
MVLEQAQRELPFVTRCESEAVAHHQFDPTGSKDLASTRARA